ncbi:hypothetical protein V8E54_003682 [Elaphomyces granulatus]
MTLIRTGGSHETSHQTQRSKSLTPDVVPRRRWTIRNGTQTTTNASASNSNLRNRDTSTITRRTTSTAQAKEYGHRESPCKRFLSALPDSYSSQNPPPLNQPAPAPEPPRIPLQAVPHSSPGYFDAMRPPTAPSNWPQQQNSSIFQAQPPFSSPTCTSLPAPSSELPRIPLQTVPPGYYDAMWPPTAPSNLSQPPNPSIFQAHLLIVRQTGRRRESACKQFLTSMPCGRLRRLMDGHSSQTLAPQRAYRTVIQ